MQEVRPFRSFCASTAPLKSSVPAVDRPAGITVKHPYRTVVFYPLGDTPEEVSALTGRSFN